MEKKVENPCSMTLLFVILFVLSMTQIKRAYTVQRFFFKKHQNSRFMYIVSFYTKEHYLSFDAESIMLSILHLTGVCFFFYKITVRYWKNTYRAIVMQSIA